MPCRLWLIMVEAPPGSDGGEPSRLGRALLSRLAALQDLDCDPAGWSPRGAGPPRHPALPRPWRACLSHRDGRVVAGLADAPVGLDLEHARPRHARRLAGLVEQLPEPEVRRAVLDDACPQAAFYRAFTLHEALYKLESQGGETPAGVLATRLAWLAPTGRAHAWQWQRGDWTLAVTAYADVLRLHSLPRLPLHRRQGVRKKSTEARMNIPDPPDRRDTFDTP